MTCLRRPPLSLEQLEQVRYEYEQTTLTVEEIAARYRYSTSAIQSWARRYGWTRRRAVLPREGPPPRPLPAPDVAPAAQTDGAAVASSAPGEPALPDGTPLALRLQRTVERQLAALEAVVATLGATRPHAGESERAARALATLTRTLRELNALQNQNPEPAAHDDSRSDDIDERRLALARKIDALVAGANGEGAGEPEPARA